MTRPEELDARARLLRAAVGFALVPPTEPELRVPHQWLDCWRGVGDVVRGMARQGWDLQLTEYDAEHWRATFFVAGQAHSVVGGSASQIPPRRSTNGKRVSAGIPTRTVYFTAPKRK